MAVNTMRSMNHDFGEGMTDRKYKKIASGDRGGVVEAATERNQMHLSDVYYGVNTESHVKIRPDGKSTL